MKPCDDNIRKTLELADRMVEVADSGDRAREDVGCGVLYGVLRDSAFKIRKLAEAERDAHIQKGWWSPGGSTGELRPVPRQPRSRKLG
jgi:hypothetical protein